MFTNSSQIMSFKWYNIDIHSLFIKLFGLATYEGPAYAEKINNLETSTSQSHISKDDPFYKYRETSRLLTAAIEHKYTIIEKMKKEAVLMSKKNKNAALNILKQKKKLEEQIKRLEGSKSNIDSKLLELDNVKLNNEILVTLNGLREEINKQLKGIDVEDVDDLYGDLELQSQNVDEIQKVISSPINQDQAIEDEILEDTLEDELNALLESSEKETVNINDSTLSEEEELEMLNNSMMVNTNNNNNSPVLVRNNVNQQSTNNIIKKPYRYVDSSQKANNNNNNNKVLVYE